MVDGGLKLEARRLKRIDCLCYQSGHSGAAAAGLSSTGPVMFLSLLHILILQEEPELS